MRFLKGRGKTKGAMPKLFDECIYSPYSYRKDEGRMTSPSAMRKRRPSGEDDEERRRTDSSAVHEEEEDDHRVVEDVHRVQSQPQRRFSDSAIEIDENTDRRREDLIDLSTAAGDTTLDTGDTSQSTHPNLSRAETSLSNNDDSHQPDLDTTVHIPEVFLFEYGVVVIWGMSLKEEQRFLKEIAKFEQEKLSKDDVQTEEFNFYYTREYQARIYNDFISLREKRNYMTKLAISHALAQSTKVSTSPPHDPTQPC
jgi:uncharacterized Rmd1/YagE family protein